MTTVHALVRKPHHTDRPGETADRRRDGRLSADSQRTVTSVPPAVGTNGGMTPGRQGLDTAEGVLIALRQCTIDEAFREMIRAAQQHQVPLFTLADALVTAASGRAECPNPAARAAVLAEWGSLLTGRGAAPLVLWKG